MIHFSPIGLLHSPLVERFGIPRQANLVPIHAQIHCPAPYHTSEAWTGLAEFSHIWLLWHFNGNKGTATYRPLVRPPRLGGNTTTGVFASRSMYRPNPIGLSAVKLLGVEHTATHTIVHTEGADLLHGTPILDIKPYIAYSDAIASAYQVYAQPSNQLPVQWLLPACSSTNSLTPHDKHCIELLLSQQPQPAYHNNPTRVYGMRYANVNVRFIVLAQGINVVDITPI